MFELCQIVVGALIGRSKCDFSGEIAFAENCLLAVLAHPHIHSYLANRFLYDNVSHCQALVAATGSGF